MNAPTCPGCGNPARPKKQRPGFFLTCGDPKCARKQEAAGKREYRKQLKAETGTLKVPHENGVSEGNYCE